MQKSVEEALNQWMEKHNATDMNREEAACRFMLEVINDTPFSDDKYKDRLLKALNEYSKIVAGVDLNGEAD